MTEVESITRLVIWIATPSTIVYISYLILKLIFKFSETKPPYILMKLVVFLASFFLILAEIGGFAFGLISSLGTLFLLMGITAIPAGVACLVVFLTFNREEQYYLVTLSPLIKQSSG